MCIIHKGSSGLQSIISRTKLSNGGYRHSLQSLTKSTLNVTGHLPTTQTNMKDWITILTFTYPHEAHLAKGKLESEGIEVQIADEMTVQVNNFYSNAIGGVKLKVRKTDLQRANHILINSGYLKQEEQIDNKFLNWIDKFTARFPLIGKTILEIRPIAFIMTILILIATPIVLLSIPSKLERLTENSWCVDKLYYKGQELTPNSLGIKFISDYDNCFERMSFDKDGTVDFPGIDSYGVSALWKIQNDSLIIYPPPVENDYQIGENLEIIEIENQTPVEKSIYHGNYIFKIKNNYISMKSDSLTIIGKVYRSNFSFGF
jgi:hypothetical protein